MHSPLLSSFSLDTGPEIVYSNQAVKAKALSAEEGGMKQDAFAMTLLFDYYGELLTEKQKTCFDLYYNQDLSLSEIAEEAGVTRQGVHDTLARAEAILTRMEEKTGCIARARRTQQALDEITAAAQTLRSVPGAEAAAQAILSAAEEIKE